MIYGLQKNCFQKIRWCFSDLPVFIFFLLPCTIVSLKGEAASLFKWNKKLSSILFYHLNNGFLAMILRVFTNFGHLKKQFIPKKSIRCQKWTRSLIPIHKTKIVPRCKMKHNVYLKPSHGLLNPAIA